MVIKKTLINFKFHKIILINLNLCLKYLEPDENSWKIKCNQVEDEIDGNDEKNCSKLKKNF